MNARKIEYYMYDIYCVCSSVELICVRLFEIIKKHKMKKKTQNKKENRNPAAVEKQHKYLPRQESFSPNRD